MKRARVTWLGDAARAKIVAKAGKRAARVANRLAGMIRRNISTAGPDPSSPGEYPHKQTGELKQGIRVIQRNQYRWDVVSEAPHAAAVERTRPYMQRTLDEGLTALQREARRA